MKIAITIIAVLIGLLSIAAGGAKVALVPEEVEFLGQFGLTNALIVVFGTVQVLGGLLMVIPKTRVVGSIIAALGFAVSAVLLLMAGNAAFAGVSLVPVVLALVVAFKGSERRPVDGTFEADA
ncbi:MAG: hypothetical protein HKM98_02760 [Gammaproteobacteria bacterium]|nr:hypothetical protein [Gammaproteobacteria bacterium]